MIFANASMGHMHDRETSVMISNAKLQDSITNSPGLANLHPLAEMILAINMLIYRQIISLTKHGIDKDIFTLQSRFENTVFDMQWGLRSVLLFRA